MKRTGSHCMILLAFSFRRNLRGDSCSLHLLACIYFGSLPDSLSKFEQMLVNHTNIFLDISLSYNDMFRFARCRTRSLREVSMP
jgi:hypothetical protein